MKNSAENPAAQTDNPTAETEHTTTQSDEITTVEIAAEQAIHLYGIAVEEVEQGLVVTF